MEIQKLVWIVFAVAKMKFLPPIDRVRVLDALLEGMGLRGDSDEEWMKAVLDHMIQDEEMEYIKAMGGSNETKNP